MKTGVALSIVVPLYNEEESILPLYGKIRSACEVVGRPFEIIFVDDGSQDRSGECLLMLHRTDPAVKVVQFRKNYGQTAAMAAGFRAARGAIVISMDGDLQNDPSDIPLFLDKLDEGYDVVCGWRRDRKDKLISRKIPSKVANWLIGKITGVPIHDNGCSLKAYRSDVIKRVPLYSEMHRFIPAMSTLTGARIAEIEVRHHARQFGKSKYGISRAWRVFLDLFLVKMLTGFAANPLLWFASLSLPVLALGLVWLAEAAVVGVSGIVFPVLAFLSFFLAGHLVAMGVLGEMVLRSGDFRPDKMLAKMAIARRTPGFQTEEKE